MSHSRYFSLLPLLGITLLTFAPRAVAADDPRVFIELGKGVSYAKEGNRLVLFLLVENFAEESAAILSAINQELSGKESEFAIVRCRNESADHRKLFKERFKQDPDQMPLGVIATAAGKMVTGTNGKSPEAYRIMIQSGRIQAGFENDPAKIAALQNAIESDEAAASSIFGLMPSEVAVTRQLLTDYREWKFNDGTTIKAALLQANGPTGTFVTMDKKEHELDFNTLSDDDKNYLTSILGEGQ
tara:strand:+ start:380 stop:1108 length:729 start_codon:yes stop_codon:yes gene_type:complete